MRAREERWYVVVGAGDVPNEKREAAERVLRVAVRACGLPELATYTIRWFRPETRFDREFAEMLATRFGFALGGYAPVSSRPGTRLFGSCGDDNEGWLSRGAATIWVAADMPLRRTLLAVAHEVRHLMQSTAAGFTWGDDAPSSAWEVDARDLPRTCWRVPISPTSGRTKMKDEATIRARLEQEWRRAAISVPLDAAQCEGLREFSRASGVPLSALLAALFTPFIDAQLAEFRARRERNAARADGGRSDD